MKRFILWSLATFFFGGLALSPGMLIYFYNEQPPITYSVRKVLTPKVAPGEKLRIQIAGDVNKRCDALVYRAIVDASGRRHGFDPESRPFETNYVVEMIVPLGAYPGPASYSPRLEWACNWVQRWFPQEVIQRELEFEITPSEGQLPMPGQQGIYQAPIKKSEYARIQQ